LNAQRDDGLISVYDMAQKEQFHFYGEDKYWNLQLKEEFMDDTTTLWKDLSQNKYHGQLFYISDPRNELTADQWALADQVESDLFDAVKKHGRASYTKEYVDEFNEEIAKKKEEIINTQLKASTA